MLLCSIDEVRPGDVVGSPIAHPERPQVELVRPGTVLRPGMPERLRGFGVHQVWLNCDGTEDLDHAVGESLTKAQQEVFDSLKDTFRAAGGKTMGAGTVGAFKQTVMDLVCNVVSNRRYAGLSQSLHRTDDDLFRHSAAVAYLCVVIGVELQSYIVRERSRLNPRDAAELSPLGLAGMLADIGKIATPDITQIHEAHLECNNRADWPADYEAHTLAGYAMLENAGAPSSARQAVLMHHQHWDGSGFPTYDQMGKNDPEKGIAPSGTDIHVFSRIVLAANTVEALMHEAGANLSDPASHRVPAHALADFASRKYDGWFDPEVRRAVMRCIPPFPIGSSVLLTSGESAVVVTPNREMPCLPTVRMMEGSIATGEDLDLSISGGVRIREAGGVDVSGVDYMPNLVQNENRSSAA